MSFKPTLAASIEPFLFHKLKFPLLLSPKYDGIRAISMEGGLKSRTLKSIPSAQAQALFGGLTHFDGELIAGDIDGGDVYNRTQSHVMSQDKPADKLRYFVFDWADPEMAGLPFEERYDYLSAKVEQLGREDVVLVPQFRAHCIADFLAYEQHILEKGYEGIMARAPAARYKHGRSTFSEHVLLKLKRFEDIELKITGFQEQMTNTNEAVMDELGHTKRSSAQAGMIPAGTLGKFVTASGPIPCGVLTHSQRAEIWNNRDFFLGQWIKVRHFPYGAQEGLRLPRCVGFRDPIDM